VDLLHGYSREAFYGAPSEITGLNVGFVGFGTSGRMTADALQTFGAEIFYYARSRKENAEAGGMHYLPLHELLAQSDVIITCLNKNVILLHEKEFQKIGSGKIMINTSIGPASDMEPLFRWIQDPRNIFCCDTRAALGPIADQALALPNVRCRYASAGMTRQAYDLLSKKVLDNMKAALRELS
jgi:phosphoglycerate dehydrogenase-like enzyme